MKKKTLLALGAVSLLGVATTVVLPLTLTSCSDEKTNQQPQPNPNIQVKISQSKEGTLITLTASVSVNNNSDNNKNSFGYQWYYKEKSGTSFLEFNPDPDAIKGFTSITNATSSTLKINTTEYPTTNLEKYEFICAAYETANPANYGLANPISISVDTSNTPSGNTSPQEPPASNSGSSNGNQQNDNHSGSEHNNENNSNSSTKYISIDFHNFVGKTFNINDPNLKNLFEYYKGKDVNIWSSNDLYNEIAKLIDSNYKSDKSLMYWMTCKNVRYDNQKHYYIFEVQVFSNTKNGYWFKNKETNKVTNSLLFTEAVNFQNNSNKSK